MASAIDSEPIQARRIIVKNFAARKGENYEECKQVGFHLQSQNSWIRPGLVVTVKSLDLILFFGDIKNILSPTQSWDKGTLTGNIQ